MFEGHQAPVTGIDTHNIPGPIDFSHLFITSSMDWTVKLWSTRDSRPLYSFEDNSGYVYDAAWSPLHPAMFAAVDGSGRLDVWKLNLDQEVSRIKKSCACFPFPFHSCKSLSIAGPEGTCADGGLCPCGFE